MTKKQKMEIGCAGMQAAGALVMLIGMIAGEVVKHVKS